MMVVEWYQSQSYLTTPAFLSRLTGSGEHP